MFSLLLCYYKILIIVKKKSNFSAYHFSCFTLFLIDFALTVLVFKFQKEASVSESLSPKKSENNDRKRKHKGDDSEVRLFVIKVSIFFFCIFSIRENVNIILFAYLILESKK